MEHVSPHDTWHGQRVVIVAVNLCVSMYAVTILARLADDAEARVFGHFLASLDKNSVEVRKPPDGIDNLAGAVVETARQAQHDDVANN